MFIEFIFFIIVTLGLIYRWATINNRFFEERGIPFDKPFPLFGSLKELFMRKKSIFNVVNELYAKSDGRVFGIFDQRSPVLLIRDPQLAKLITIKDFDHFVNHRPLFFDAEDENLFSCSMMAMQDEKWKHMRSTLSPVFTGSKMRQMFELMNKVAQETVNFMKQEQGIKHGLELNLKEYSTRFTSDIIASIAFGLDVNSFKNPDNEFYRMGQSFTTFSVWQSIKFMLSFHLKGILKYFKIDLLRPQNSEYFVKLVLGSMRQRKEQNIIRPDMINLLMQARGLLSSDNPKTHNEQWSDIEMVAQCTLFFGAGFETVSLLMCFAAQELMENPTIQEKLYDEIQDVSAQLEDGQTPSYEVLQHMRYMDMVVSEVLRKWPAAVVIDRYCSKDITYEINGERVEIKKGDDIWIPVSGFHYDNQYFENPLRFDPERFNEENKSNITPFTYMPFGAGPRNCIGSRLALLEAKAILFYLVREFYIEAGAKTVIPIQLAPLGFALTPKHGFWLKFTARSAT